MLTERQREVSDRLLQHFCWAVDNLGDMPISKKWAHEWETTARGLLDEWRSVFHDDPGAAVRPTDRIIFGLERMRSAPRVVEDAKVLDDALCILNGMRGVADQAFLASLSPIGYCGYVETPREVREDVWVPVWTQCFAKEADPSWENPKALYTRQQIIEACLKGPDFVLRSVLAVLGPRVPDSVEDAGARYEWEEALRLIYNYLGRSDGRARPIEERASEVQCVYCERPGAMFVKYSETIEVGGEKITAHGLEGHYCEHCGSTSVSPRQARYNESRFAVARSTSKPLTTERDLQSVGNDEE